MQNAEEQDTCRICSAPAEPDQPLFHPCKCSGTIRYIHQDCLTTWLSHSKKKTCDVCKHPYSFKKVYAPDMPSRLPPLLLIRKLVQQTLFAILFGLRGVLVGTIWLAALPWATVWTWRMYFSMGESAAWWISGRARPNTTQDSPFYYNIQSDSSASPPTTFLGWLMTHPLWIALSADIFTGQIIASLIVLTFVAVFLLREWISQHARPGIFEDEELLPDDPPLRAELPADAAQPGRPQPRDRNPLDEALARRQIETMRAVDALRARDGVNGHVVGDDRAHGRSPIDLPRRKGKGKRGRYDQFDSDSRTTLRRKIFSDSRKETGEWEPDPEEERLKRHSFSRRVFTARMTGARRKAALAASGGLRDVAPLDVDSRVRFTFTPDSAAENKVGQPSEGKISLASILPPVTLQPPRAAIPFSFDHVKSAASSPTDQSDHDVNDNNDNSSSPSSSLLDHSRTRRPPLPTSISPATSRVSSPAHTPVDPPGLATYHAPEELEGEAGPSHLPEPIASSASDDSDSSEEEHNEVSMPQDYGDYFEEPDSPAQKEASDEDSDDEAANGDGAHDSGDQAKESENEDDDAEEEEGGGIEDTDLEWEPAEDDGDDQALPVVPDDNPPPPAQGAPAEGGPANNGVPPELAEELEGNVEDDMEGAMEAIGMRGPIYGVLQNAALMIFVLDTAIGLGVWIPFTVGKSTALLLMDPPRLLQILHLPIRAIRLVTDPIVDSAVFCFLELIYPTLERALLGFASYASTGALRLVARLFSQSVAEGVVNTASKLGSNVIIRTEQSFQYLSTLTSSALQPQAGTMTPSFLALGLDNIIDLAEPQFTWLGLRVRLAVRQLQLAWIRLAIGEGPTDRAFAIILGYAVVGMLLAAYLNLLTMGNARSAGRAFRSAVRQQLLVLKVASFIFIELVTFPLSCGVVLDLCTVWLFREANLASRVAFFVQAPLTAIFYHWVAGTMFMYAFAVLLSGCRTVMRSGAMWFIKDPQDQNSHPIKDILDRPTLTQLRKIFVSGILYSCVVACVVGSVAGLLLMGNKSIMPFRWKNREPFSSVPIDLLFLHLVLPYTMHYFRPKKALRESATVVWKMLAKKLRLTSYFFGGRHLDEESSTRWSSLLSWSKETNTIPDGSFRRVPATDNLALPRDMRATAGVTADGQPVDNAARQLMAEQNAEIEKAKRNLKDEFITVYIPPAFGYRVIYFIALLWVIGAVLLGVAIALPILLGRRFFELFTTRQVHDGYSIIIGFYLLWGFYLIGCAIDRLDKRRKRSSGERSRADLPVLVIKRGLLWIAKSAYMALFLGIVIPTLISFVIELYVIIPIRFAVEPQMTPRVRVVEAWALGLLYVKIAMHAHRIRPANRISTGIQHIMANGWTRSDPIQATKEVIGPLVGGLLGMILLPGAVFRAMQYCLPNMPLDNRFMFMHVYPGIFMLAGLVRSAAILYSLLSSWAQSIRDKEFLVEMRLRNHEPEKSNKLDEGQGARDT